MQRNINSRISRRIIEIKKRNSKKFRSPFVSMKKKEMRAKRITLKRMNQRFELNYQKDRN